MADSTAERTKAEKKADEYGADEVKAAFDEAQKKGYFGGKVDPRPNKEYSLESGPDSPGAAEARRDIHIDDVEGN